MQRKRNFFWRLLTRDIRCDGVLVKDIDPMHRLEPFIFPTRHESIVYFREKFDVTHTLEYLKEKNASCPSQKMTLFHVFLAAIVRTAALKPKLGRFVMGKRIYERNEMQISFVVKKEFTESSRMFVVKENFLPTDTLSDVAERVRASVERAREKGNTESENLIRSFSKMPGWMITIVVGFLRLLDNLGLLPASIVRSDPFHTGVFVTNVGSIGVGAPYHHLYEWGTTSVFVALGKYAEEWVLDGEGKPAKRTFVEVTFTVDERIADGLYLAGALQLFKKLMEQPEELEKPLEIGAGRDAQDRQRKIYK